MRADARPKHRCGAFRRIRDGFQRDIDGASRAMDGAAVRWQSRKSIQIDSLKRRMASQLNRHLARCPECDP